MGLLWKGGAPVRNTGAEDCVSRSETYVINEVCFARFACGETQSSVSFADSPFQKEPGPPQAGVLKTER